MTSVLNVDTIAAKNGTSPVTLTKQQAAKAFNNFNGTGTVAIRESFNVSSLTDNATAEQSSNLTNSMSSNLSGFGKSTSERELPPRKRE